MDMINVPVTLIVKAPNQQIEDQTIKCEPSWSIRKLKGYLAEVYPSKPRTEDQKLIYSGQLLSDTVILKDVLRKYDGQETHTVHLVCSSARESLGQRSSPAGSRPSARMNETRRDSSSTLPRGEESQSPGNVESSSDGLRQRLSTASVPGPTAPQCNVAASGAVPGPGAFPTTTDPRAMWAAAMAQPYPAPVYDPNNLAQQLMYMQQAYVQYMSQYMQMLAANAAQQSMSGPQPTLQVPEQPPINNQPEPPVEDVANGPAGDDEEGRGNRDWLDWFYIMSRVMVLFSIVYFYSSPTRFVLVSALGMMMYLYQVGFFRAQQLQPVHVEAENNNHPADARLVDNNNLQNIQEEETTSTDQDDESAAETEETDNEAAEVQEERPSLLALTWTFFSTFFASLIPEQPEV